MKNRILYAAALFAAFFALLAALALVSERDASQVRNAVLRLHIVANSDSETDQNNKMKVRDGIASLCSELFYGERDKSAVMAAARENAPLIEARAAEILRENGASYPVSVVVRRRFFPTRAYEGVSLPAGVYDTVDVRLGEAEGKNFWCVMFPAICVGASSSRDNLDKMSDVLSGGALELVSPRGGVRLRFAAVELLEKLKHFLRIA